MKHLRKYNEEAIWDYLKFGKNKLWIKTANLKKKTGGDLYRFHSKLAKGMIIDRMSPIAVSGRGGAFVKSTYLYNWKDYVLDDDVWYDATPIFKRLRNISKNLGYKIGASVNNKTLGMDDKIVDICDFSFYDNTSLLSSATPYWTLLYKMEYDGKWYCVDAIDLLDDRRKKDNIVDEVIKENFYDLLDEDLITFSSEKKFNMSNVFFMCEMITSSYDTSLLKKIFEYLDVAGNRLKDQNIRLTIKSVNSIEYNADGIPKMSIKFNCYQEK